MDQVKDMVDVIMSIDPDIRKRILHKTIYMTSIKPKRAVKEKKELTDEEKKARDAERSRKYYAMHRDEILRKLKRDDEGKSPEELERLERIKERSRRYYQEKKSQKVEVE